MPVHGRQLDSDGMLIAAALAGEEAAFALLVQRYQAPLLRAAMSRLGRREVAEEAVQETFLCAHRWLASYDSRYSFRTWLWTILLNQCSRQAKRELKQAASAAVEEPCSPQPSPWEALLERENTEQLQQLLAQLPIAQADALRLRFFGGLTFAEIAAAMGCSEPGAKHRVKAGLLKLSQALVRDAGRAPSHPSATKAKKAND